LLDSLLQEIMKIDKARMVFLWRRGGNWAVFFLCWVASAAIIGAIEATQENIVLTEEAKLENERKEMTSSLYEIREEINDTEVRDHLEKLVQLMLRKEFLRVWALADKEYEQHIDLQREKLRLLKTEFEGIKDDLDKHGDKEGQDIANELVKLLSDQKTLTILNQVANKQKKDLEEARKKADDEEEHWENFSSWNFGSSMHFVSTIFTTIGYGGVTPATLGGKFMTILMIITLIPFFLHCLCTSASNLNNLIDRALGLAEHYDDLEDLTTEKPDVNERLRKEAIWKGTLFLLGGITLHMFISSIYHLATTGWNYGDVLYYEFVNYSTIGFGDLIPSDEATVGGSILKNLLVKIPAAILLATIFLRTLPVIS